MKAKKIFLSVLASLAVASSVVGLASCGGEENTPTPTPTPSVEPSETPSEPDTEPSESQTPSINQDALKVEQALKALTLDSIQNENFELKVLGAGNVTITWTSSNTDVISIDGASATVVRPGFTGQNATVTLTATAISGTEQDSKEFTVTVEKLEDESITVAEAKALELNDTSYIRGIVTGYCYNKSEDGGFAAGFYVTDATGTIYVYGSQTASEVALGDEVYLKGTRAVYSNGMQMSSPDDVQIISQNNEADWTAVITDKTIADIQSNIDVTNNNLSSNVYNLTVKIYKDSYGNYGLEDLNNSGKTLGVYLGGSKGTAPEAYSTLLEAYIGQIVNVKYVVNSTNSSGDKWRGHVLEVSELSDEAKATIELENIVSQLTLSATDEAKEIELATIYNESQINVTLPAESKILSYDAGKFTITPITEEVTETFEISVTVGSVTLKENIEISTLARSYYVYNLVTKLKEDTPYIMIVEQKGIDKTLYPTGQLSGNYGETTEDRSATVQFYVESSESGYYLYYLTGETKTYLNLVESVTSSGTKVNLSYDSTASSVWTMNETYNTLVTLIGTESYYIGTYNNYVTLSASKLSYAASSYVSNLYEIEKLSFDPEITSFDVVFNSNGGSEVDTQSVLYGQLAQTPEAPTYTNKSFTGWYTDEACTNVYDFNSPVKSLVTLYAGWTDLDVFTISFSTGEGSAVEDQLIIDGNVVVKPEDPTLTLMTFDGWYTDEACTVAYDFESIVSSSFTLYAKWVDVTPLTYEEYMAAADAATVIVKGYVNLISGNNVFLTDENGNGYYLYGAVADAQLGEEYVVCGEKDIYNNLHEIKNFVYKKTENTKSIIPVDVTEDITINGFNVTTANQNQYVTFTGTLTGEKEVTVGQNKVALFYKCATPALPVGSTVTVTGLYSVYKTTSQIQIWSTDSVIDNTEDSVKVGIEIDNLVSLFSSSYALNSTVTITPVYDTSVVTVTLPQESKILVYENSVLTITPIEEEVTETITISVQINNETATQEVKITTTAKVAGVENGSVNLVYTAGTTTNMDGTNQAELLGLDSTLFTVVGVKNDASNNVGLNKSGELRLYGNAEQNGTSLEISIISPENKTATITSIEITFTAAAGATVNGVDVADNTEFVINGASVIIKNANASTTQVKFTSIKINYTIA